MAKPSQWAVFVISIFCIFSTEASTAPVPDPFVEHGKLMVDAIQRSDLRRVQMLLKTPYIDPNGYKDGGRLFSFVRLVLGTVQPIPILTALIGAGADEAGLREFVSPSANAFVFAVRSLRAASDVSVLEILFKGNFALSAPSDIFETFKGLRFSMQPTVTLGPISVAQYSAALQILADHKISLKGTFGIRAGHFEPEDVFDLSQPASWPALFPLVDVNETDAWGNTLLNSQIRAGCRVDVFLKSKIGYRYDCSKDNSARAPFVRAIIARPEFNRANYLKQNQGGFTPFDFLTQTKFDSGCNTSPADVDAIQSDLTNLLRSQPEYSSWKPVSGAECRPLNPNIPVMTCRCLQ
jgi:hypothetical protein